MPQIPVFTGNQRIDPSSPVPLTSPESSAGNLQGNAVEAFGNAMFAFGNKLDEAGKNLKAKQDKLDSANAIEDFEQTAILMKAEADAAPIVEGDASGGAAARDYLTKLQAVRQEFAARISDPNVKAEFFSGANKIVSQYTSTRLAEEVHKREKAVVVAQNELLGKYTQGAFNDYTTAPEQAAKAELVLREDPNQTGAALEERVVKMRDNIFNAAVEGILTKAKQSDNFVSGVSGFINARQFVSANSKLLSTEARQKLFDRIDSDQKEFINTDWTMGQRTEQLQNKKKAESREAAKRMYTKRFELAANSDLEYAKIMLEVREDQNLKPEDIKEYATGQEEFRKFGDDRYQMRFVNDIIQNKRVDFDKLSEKLTQDVKDEKVSTSRAIKLQQVVKDLKETNRQYPNINNVISSTRQMILESYKSTKVDPLTGVPVEYIKAQGYQAAAEFDAKIARRMQQGIISPESIVSMANPKDVSKLGKGTVKEPIPGNIPGVSSMELMTEEGLNNILLQITKKDLSGKMSPAERKAEEARYNKAKAELERRKQFNKNKLPSLDLFKNGPAKSVDE